jgi:hypothetical protein
MTTVLEFFHLFFTSEMIRSIVAHTNSYAYMGECYIHHFGGGLARND